MRPRPIVLDSGPLALALQRAGLPEADACRGWVEHCRRGGTEFVVPDIVAYEVRRELVRLERSTALAGLDDLVRKPGCARLAVTEAALRRAAELWAEIRRTGRPTADRHALDIDVILAAQVLTAGWDVSELIVATSNTKHLGLFVPAAEWQTI